MVEFFEQQSQLLLNDKDAMINLFNNLPDAPALKVGDKVKVLNIIDNHPTSGMSDEELEFATTTQQIFSVITRSIQRGDLFHTLACLQQFSIINGSRNQLLFVDATDDEGNPFIAAIELDIPLSKTLFECIEPDHENIVVVGGEMVVHRIIPFPNFEEEYQNSRDIESLIEIMANHLSLEPEDGSFYSADQREKILQFAEMLGMIELAKETA